MALLLLFSLLVSMLRTAAPTRPSAIILQDSLDCFRRVGMGRLIPDSFVHLTLRTPSLEHCRVSCTSERHFRCEGFAYRWDVSACQLTATPLSALEFQEHSSGGRIEYFARDIPLHGRCPPAGGHGADALSRGPPWNRGSPNDRQGPNGGAIGPKGPSGMPHRIGGGSAAVPGFYGPPMRNPAPQVDQSIREEGFSLGGSGWSSQRGQSAPLDSENPPFDRFPAADSPGVVWHPDGRPLLSTECFVLVKRGFRLTPDGLPHPAPSNHEDAHRGDLLFVSTRVRSRGPRECAMECFRSRQFRCEAFSYRFNGDPRTQGLSNCDLSGQPLIKLDPYKDLVQDRDYDVYGRTTGRACGEDSIIMGPLDHDDYLKRPRPQPHPGGGGHAFPPSRSPPPPRGPKPMPPAYLDNSLGTGSGSSWSISSGSGKDERAGQDVTVSGRPCAPGNSCTRHPDGGFWGCPVASLEAEGASDEALGKDWDYCCRPGHQCGYSEGYHLPWCYVGSADRDQWRPCNQDHYPPPSSASSVPSSEASYNTTKGDNHHTFAYLHNEPPKAENHTAAQGQNYGLPIPSSVLDHDSGDKRPPINEEEEKESIIQKVFDLLSSGGQNKSVETEIEGNRLPSSLKTEKVTHRGNWRGKENRAYGRRAEQVRYFHPVSSSSHHLEHSREGGASLQKQETRILPSNFTIVMDETDT